MVGWLDGWRGGGEGKEGNEGNEGPFMRTAQGGTEQVAA